ncbi:hypothetical protein Pcinc_043907 [Petrolisthes cinctipes]|uniref:NADH dehydrogenase [ubiquinone] 1 alpha subcomplex subunit 7 n=1 Tax=Petrolisthes cinctipes TaxID=88211 RepID=A0AAE1BEP0_PETCI|nr:hypothetical protein Pcinc_043907 [Petrolisthes cinctipes]
MPGNYRDVSPFLGLLRKLLLGRDHTPALRQANKVVCRSQPPPALPDGVSASLSNNYYYSRDGRRMVAPPDLLVENTTTGVTQYITQGVEEDVDVSVMGKQAKTPEQHIIMVVVMFTN